MWVLKKVTSFLLGVVIVIACIPIIGLSLQCEEHEMMTVFSFQSYDSTAASHIKPVCKKCNNYFGHTAFRGTPEDKSYLDTVKDHLGADEIDYGKTHTARAIVVLGDYDYMKTKIRCKMESRNTTVFFSVEFRSEFEGSVDLLEEGDEITFRGLLYDKGFGFTDCELIK